MLLLSIDLLSNCGCVFQPFVKMFTSGFHVVIRMAVCPRHFKKQKIAHIRYHLLSSRCCASQSFIIEI